MSTYMYTYIYMNGIQSILPVGTDYGALDNGLVPVIGIGTSN